LFKADRTLISRCLKNIYLESELNKDATCAKLHKFNSREGTVNKAVDFYNLDAIIFVGYRTTPTEF
jgi:hypothetical protein